MAWWDQHPEAQSRLAALDYRIRAIDNPSSGPVVYATRAANGHAAVDVRSITSRRAETTDAEWGQ
jgi:hypothetical protein